LGTAAFVAWNVKSRLTVNGQLRLIRAHNRMPPPSVNRTPPFTRQSRMSVRLFDTSCSGENDASNF
jgi:hypothetical protein